MNTFYKAETQKTLGTAVKDLKANLLAKGFGTLFELNFKDKIEEKGFTIENDFVLIEVCHAKIASEILNANIEVGFILPCKLVVYEKENATYIGLLKPTTLIPLIDDSFTDAANEVEAILVQAVNESV